MPFSVSQLNTFYSNANLGITPSAAESLLIQAFATEDASGSLTDAQTLSSVLTLSQDKTDVALLTYQFFTGASPTIAGLQFLVNGTTNPNDLGSAFFAQFNKENRYYNFAINLATGSSSAASFAATYGTLTFAQAVTAAYENIVGSAVVGAAQAAAAEAAITALQPFFASIAASRAPLANQDIATKAIAIGYILEEAQKADVGAYARAVDQFLTQLATTGTAPTGNLLTLFPPSNVPGVTFNLTAGIDNFLGGSGNDTVNSTAQANLSALDNINGGGGSNIFNLTDSTAAITGIPASATLTNFAILNLESAVSVTFNSLADTGALQINSISATTTSLTAATTTNISATSNGNTTVTGGLNVVIADTTGADTVSGAAGTVTDVNTSVNAGANATGGAVTISGGTVDTVTLALGATSVVNFTETFGLVTVNGGAATTSVVVSEAAAKTASGTATGIVDGSVAITDVNGASATAAGTITTVSLTNVAGGTITDGALATLNLAGAVGALTLTDNNTKAPSTTLALNLTGAAAAAITDTNNEVTTANISLATSSSFGGLVDTGLKTVNVAGTGTLALTALAPSVTALNISGAVGFNGAAGAPLDLSGGAAALVVTDSSSAGVNVKIAATQTFAGAASTGKDTVTIFTDATKSIAAGTATNNEIILSGAGSVFTGAMSTTPGKISGFTVLGTDGGSSGVFDLSKLPTITSIDVTGAAAGGVQFVNVINQTPISIDTAIAGGVTYQTADATGATDSTVVTIGTAATGGITTTGQLTLQDSTLVGLGTVTINSTSAAVVAPALPVTNVVSVLNDTGLATLNFTGIANTTVANLIDNGSSLTINNNGTGVLETISAFTAPNLRTVNLSGNVASPALNLTSTAGVTISGATDNAAVTSVLTGAAATHTDTVTLGTGVDSITDTGAGTINVTLGGSAGGDTVVIANAAIANVVVAGGANSITANSAGSNNVTLGATGTAAENIILGTGTNTVVVGAHTGADNISVAAHGSTLAAVITGLNGTTTSADKITFLGDGAAAGAVTVFSVTQINAYANLHGLDSTQLSTSLAALFDTTANGGANLAIHGIGEFNFQGNTFLVEQANALGTAIGAADTVVELTGTVPVTALSIAAAGVLSFHG